MTTPKAWLSIELGYMSDVVETCEKKPPLQDIFEDLFNEATRNRWRDGGQTPIAKPDEGDKWAAQVAEEEINKALAAIGSKDRVHIKDKEQLLQLGYPVGITGEPGTRCKLSGDKWINSRSYVLLDQKGDPWLKDHPQISHTGANKWIPFVTVTWLCHATKTRSTGPVKTKILGLEIGYESRATDTCHTKRPEMQEALEGIFTKDVLKSFHQETIKEFPEAPENDLWAAEHIREMINGALTSRNVNKPSMKVRVHEEDLRFLASDGDTDDKFTGSHGTRCKESNGRWENSRSYRLLYQSNGHRWPKGREDKFLFATLTWQCWPKVE